MAFDDNKRELSIGELENANTDRSVNPAVMVRGMMAKNGSNWVYISADSTGAQVVNATVTANTSPLSADSSSVSAKQGDAGLLHISAFSNDASQMRVSALGVTVTTSPLSADSSRISAVQGDANILHTSAFVDSGSISASSGDANQFHVSAINLDAGLLRVSAILAAGVSSVGAASFGVSAAQLDAGSLHTSAFIDSGSVSAKQGDANNLHVSSVQGDAGLQHVSSYFGVDTTGQWSIGRLSNLSSSGNIKSTAGTLYGYYAYNTTTIPAYINFTNTSGAISVGTDVVQLKIMLPASAAANVGFPGGLKGFTAGIGAYAVSDISDAATTPVATSAVGINVFYN